jgi:hypothetical protein
MIKFSDEDVENLIKLAIDNKIFIEGPILKMIDTNGNTLFETYIKDAIENDQENRRKRLEITKQIQSQNAQLTDNAKENGRLMQELKGAVEKAHEAKENALNDLDIVQRKSQFELIDRIVKVALWIIMGVGIITTVLYAIALFNPTIDTTLLGSTWSNLFGILLTNSFSIIGTIMGVKYASSSKED